MTIYGLIASLAWAAIAVLFVSRLNRVANRWLDMKGKVTEGTPDIVIPDDLLGLAMGETEKWAQDQMLEVVRERYDKYHDWNKVRSAVGVAQVAN